MRKMILIPAVLAMFAASLYFVGGRSEALPSQSRKAETASAEAVFRAYIDALNRHDVEKALAFYAPDLVFRRLGQVVERSRADLRDLREWEIPMQARFEFEVVSVQGEQLTARLVESNLLYTAMQVRRPMVVEYNIRDALIREVNLKEIREEARPWPRALAEFEQWLANRPAPQTDGILREGKLVFTGDAGRRLVPFLREWQGAAAVARAANEEVLRSFFRALNRHDVEAQFRHYAPEIAFLDEGQRVVPNQERARADREFEDANNAAWSYRVLGGGLDSLDLVITEDMEYYQLLGAGARSHRVWFRFRDGKIAAGEAWDWTQTGRPYEATRDAFIQWLLRERPDVAAEITQNGRLRFQRATAARINEMVRQWRARTAP